MNNTSVIAMLKGSFCFNCRDTLGGVEGRKRRSDMTAPPPVAKETLRADSDRQRQMVTLRRASKKGEETKPKGTTGDMSSSSTTDKQDKKVSVSYRETDKYLLMLLVLLVG